jgi:hypothetical protein
MLEVKVMKVILVISNKASSSIIVVENATLKSCDGYLTWIKAYDKGKTPAPFEMQIRSHGSSRVHELLFEEMIDLRALSNLISTNTKEPLRIVFSSVYSGQAETVARLYFSYEEGVTIRNFDGVNLENLIKILRLLQRIHLS